MMAKNMNKINHSAIKLRITGRLELEPTLVKNRANQELCVHRRLEQLVQAVRSLDKLEGDCHDEQFLQRCEDAILRPKSDQKCRDQATQTHNGVEEIPAIRAETVPPQPIATDSGIKNGHTRDCQEKVIYNSSDGTSQTEHKGGDVLRMSSITPPAE
jgi:hypothetical protein